jgi:hypothetical protein
MYLDELREAIDAAGYEVLDVEEEYVVEDSNPSLDAGWIRDAGAGPGAWSDPDWILANERRARSAPAGSPLYPSTYQPVTRRPGVEQRGAFDPALLHYQRAYRAGDPTFADERLGLAWRRARRAAIEHVLTAVAGSPWAAHLVLRGSVLLWAWLGEAAREPGDIDFVVTPPDIALDSAPARDLFDGVITAVTGGPTGTVAFDLERVAVEDIWTYERAPGRRMVFTWQAEGLPAGIVQIDLVFNERLPEPPITVAVPRSDGRAPIELAAASPRLSLAWKLLWLETDCRSRPRRPTRSGFSWSRLNSPRC